MPSLLGRRALGVQRTARPTEGIPRSAQQRCKICVLGVTSVTDTCSLKSQSDETTNLFPSLSLNIA